MSPLGTPTGTGAPSGNGEPFTGTGDGLGIAGFCNFDEPDLSLELIASAPQQLEVTMARVHVYIVVDAPLTITPGADTTTYRTSDGTLTLTVNNAAIDNHYVATVDWIEAGAPHSASVWCFR